MSETDRVSLYGRGVEPGWDGRGKGSPRCYLCVGELQVRGAVIRETCGGCNTPVAGRSISDVLGGERVSIGYPDVLRSGDLVSASPCNCGGRQDSGEGGARGSWDGWY